MYPGRLEKDYIIVAMETGRWDGDGSGGDGGGGFDGPSCC